MEIEKIKRYDCGNAPALFYESYGEAIMEEWEEGDYVKYEDHKK